ncbi:MAG: prephenate dehydrogenase/arogenate dehydrogenase family protein, partial [Pseudomonadota bacterium]
MTIRNVAIIGLGLLGGSIGLAIRDRAPEIATRGFDKDREVRKAAAERNLAGTVCDTIEEAVAEAELVILCVPMGAMGAAANAMASAVPAKAIISDVGSSKKGVAETLAEALPAHVIIPATGCAG